MVDNFNIWVTSGTRHNDHFRQVSNLERPGVERPGVERPGVERPGVERPGVERPGVERPGVEMLHCICT